MNALPTESIWLNPLVRHLAVILAAKMLLLTILWWFFFRIPAHEVTTVIDVQNHIAGYPPTAKINFIE